MPSDIVEIHVVTERPDRRALLARFCEELGRALAGEQRWEGDVVMPWHASASAFDALPERLADVIFVACDDAGGQVAAIELSGYLETDHGFRAWGSLMAREGEGATRLPALESCTVERAGEGYRLDATLRVKDGVDD